MPNAESDFNPLAEFRERLRLERERLAGMDWAQPPDEPEPEPANLFRLAPEYGRGLPLAPEGLTMDEIRAALPEKLTGYLICDSLEALLVKVPPGVGKTHAMSAVAQELSEQGYRGLWCGQRHDMFAEIASLPHFDPHRWWHWQPISGEINQIDACRYADAQRAWSERGYHAMDLCWQLCKPDGWYKRCPYRLQEKRKERVIFAQHAHLVNGLSIDRFHYAVVDELPLGAFVEDRVIEVKDLDVGAIGPLGLLIAKLVDRCQWAPDRRRVAGRELWDQIGELFGAALEATDADYGLPAMPRVYKADEVQWVKHWYVFDLLRLGAQEHEAWKSGWPAWNERVWVTSKGLHLLDRKQPWNKLPAKLVVLDATAQPELYRMIFGRGVEVYAPAARRVGTLKQIAGRTNGKQAVLDGDQISQYGREMLDIAQRLTASAKHPGVICYKSLRPHAEKLFDTVLTFGALRGSNRMEHCDAVVILGTPTPNQSQMLDLATAITGQREPFFKLDEKGMREPASEYRLRAYRFTPAGLVEWQQQFEGATGARRNVREYRSPALRAIHAQLREAELVQAEHRARINVRAATVWLVTSTPLDEPLDGLYQDPPIGPAGIDWKIWQKLEPWLSDRHAQGLSVTYADLAEWLGPKKNKKTGEETDRANYFRDHGYLRIIMQYQPELWEESLRPKGGKGGRPEKSIAPK